MKIHLLTLLPTVKSIFTLIITIALLCGLQTARAASASDLLEKGIYTEETKGDLKAASEIYRQIASDPRADRSLVAQAQLRVGICELKLGHKPQAISALEQLTREFPDQQKLLAMIEQRMPKSLEEMLRQIEQNYILEVDRSELMETAIHAIIGKLDSRAALLRTNDMELLGPKALSDLNIGLDQKVAGIGAELRLDDLTHEVLVRTPLPDSPALRAGLRAGDRILKIDGFELPPEKAMETALKLLRGQPGTTVVAGVKRVGSDSILQIEIVRDTVHLQTVKGDRYKPDHAWDFMLDEKRRIGYIRLTQFGKQTGAEMRAALNDLENRGMKALILDLRNNPGGSLDEAVAVSDLFIESGRIVTVKSRKGEQVYNARPEDTFAGFPIALLVDRNTASAAEIVAGCLQDHQRAVVIGERTFGQGIVRSLAHLQGGGALKLPIAAYYRPNGKNVNRYPNSTETDDWGVRPDKDYELSVTEEERTNLAKHRSARDIVGAEPPQAEFEDRQLKKALDYVIAASEKK
jgi:carboxyl-terminal processing protease